MSKFNVGDKVRRINHNNGYVDGRVVKVGTIGTIHDFDKYGFVTLNIGGKLYESNDPENLELTNISTEKIVITNDGKTTKATLYREDGSKETATASCAPEDTFDFNVGAKLALERLTEKTNLPKKSNIKFKTGDYAKIVDNIHRHKFEIGTIVKLEKGENDYKAFADNDYCYVTDEELEAYTPPKYYNGKVVCISNSYPGRFPCFGFTVGKIYEVTNGRITADNGWTCYNQYHTVEELCQGIGNTFIYIVE